MDEQEIKKVIAEVVSRHDADIIVYAGVIDRFGYEEVSRVCRMEKTKENAVLVLSTVGGDPHAGYRVARALTHHYGGYSILIPGICKSAGTLICLGAKEVIMADQAELGPLDMQVRKSDELFDMGSGLDTVQALNYMQAQAMNAFRDYMVELKVQGGISTRMAAEIASKFAASLFGPVYSQIDPVRLAELQRTIEIGYAYGQRLSGSSKNLKQDALNKLVSEYPSHGFVIDRKEARDIFAHIRQPEDAEIDLALFLYHHELNKPSGMAKIFNLNNLIGGRRDDPSIDAENVSSTEQGADAGESTIVEFGQGSDPRAALG